MFLIIMIKEKIKEIVEQIVKDFCASIEIEYPDGKKEEVFVGVTKIMSYVDDWDEYFESYEFKTYTFEPIQMLDLDAILESDISYYYITVDFLFESEVQEEFIGKLILHSDIIPYREMFDYYDWSHSVNCVVEDIVMKDKSVKEAIESEVEDKKDEEDIVTLINLLNNYADKLADYIKSLKFTLLETEWFDIEED